MIIPYHIKWYGLIICKIHRYRTIIPQVVNGIRVCRYETMKSRTNVKQDLQSERQQQRSKHIQSRNQEITQASQQARKTKTNVHHPSRNQTQPTQLTARQQQIRSDK